MAGLVRVSPNRIAKAIARPFGAHTYPSLHRLWAPGCKRLHRLSAAGTKLARSMGGWRPRDRRASTRYALVPTASVAAAAASGGFTFDELALLGAPVERLDVVRPDGSRLTCVRIAAELSPPQS